MTIDVVLITLQTLFLSLYGVHGMVHTVKAEQQRWFMVLATVLLVVLASLLFKDLLGSSIQLVLLMLLVLDYILSFQDASARQPGRTVIKGAITFTAYALLYFLWDHWIVWVAALAVCGLSMIVVKKWPAGLAMGQDYFLKAGTLLTLLFVLEPLFVNVQQNLKPIATIPITSIINRQTFLLLGGMLLLVLSGFFWKEKSRL